MIGRHPALQLGSRTVSTLSNSFPSRDSRTLFTPLSDRIARNSFHITALRTLAKTTEGCPFFSPDFPFSLPHFPSFLFVSRRLPPLCHFPKHQLPSNQQPAASFPKSPGWAYPVPLAQSDQQLPASFFSTAQNRLTSSDFATLQRRETTSTGVPST